MHIRSIQFFKRKLAVKSVSVTVEQVAIHTLQSHGNRHTNLRRGGSGQDAAKSGLGTGNRAVGDGVNAEMFNDGRNNLYGCIGST